MGLNKNFDTKNWWSSWESPALIAAIHFLFFFVQNEHVGWSKHVSFINSNLYIIPAVCVCVCACVCVCVCVYGRERDIKKLINTSQSLIRR